VGIELEERFTGVATPTYSNPKPIQRAAASDGMCPTTAAASAGSPPFHYSTTGPPSRHRAGAAPYTGVYAAAVPQQ